jgi:ABC-type Fe3+-hydroxamate transport system substrate-binding protein
MTCTDQMQRTIQIAHWPPTRIVSLVPSQTELLADLGLDAAVAGITKFCIHPAQWFKSKKRIGGTKTVNLETVAQLAPDLIIGNKEENVQTQIAWLSERFPVWMSDVHTLEDALDMVQQIGEITEKRQAGLDLRAEIRRRFDALPMPAQRPRAAYFIWRKPYMVAAANTFIDQMLFYAGFENAFSQMLRYPEMREPELIAANPDVILLSSEPYPFAEKHIREFQALLPNTPVRIVNGEFFSWYGSRLLQAPAYFQTFIAPQNNNLTS